MKTETIVIIALVVIIILMVMHRRAFGGPQIIVSGPSKKNAVITTSAILNYNLTLQPGSKGPEVSKLQAWLGVPQTGTFDQATANALQAALNVTSITLAQYQAQAPTAQVTPIPSNNSSNLLSGPDLSSLNLASGSLETV